MFPYRFLVVHPPCAGTALGEAQQVLTIRAERPADAYRRLWQMIDDLHRDKGPVPLPDVFQWFGVPMPQD